MCKEEINEIVLVGESVKIPRIKAFLKEYFNGIIRINDSINPEETIAYGATIMAAKLLKKKEDLYLHNLMDITPLSLGINILNNSPDPEIKKEGDIMSILIKRGTKIPFFINKTYQTSVDNQTAVCIDIFEGEKKYVKYNHLLSKVELLNIPKKKKGEVKIDVKFSIDVNGILKVTVAMKSSNNYFEIIETKIKNDTISLTENDIEELKEKNKALYHKTITNSRGNIVIDYSNLKEILKEFQHIFINSEDGEEKYNILKNYIKVLKEFIKLFDKNFDNETILEKYYIYVKELINSYIIMLNMKGCLTQYDKEEIIKDINEYIKVFGKQSSGYLDNLIEMMKNINKKIFFEIIVLFIEELNNLGKACLKERKTYCRYHSLIYFEKAYSFFKKYIGDLKKLIICSKEIREKCKNEVAVSVSYFKDINSNTILLTTDLLKPDNLEIISIGTGFTGALFGLKLSYWDEKEKYEIVLSNYEKMLLELSDKSSLEKALCIASILKIAIRYLGKSNYQKYMELGEICECIVNELKINKNEKWYKEFEEIFKEIKENCEIIEKKNLMSNK